MGFIFGDEDKSTAGNQAAIRSFEGIQLPEIEKMKLDLEEQVLQGLISPEDAEAFLLQASEMQNIQTDPGLKQAQLAALSSLQEIGQDGMTSREKADLAKLRQDEDTRARGAQQSILQNAQQRGVAGSGLEMLAAMQNQQESAGRRNLAELEINAQAQQRALEALQQQGALAGQLRGQDFNEASQKAQAQDIINRFNTENRQNVQNMNVQNRNQAQVQNLQNKQSISNNNVDTRNQQQQFNKGLQQQRFQNEIQRAGGVANTQQAAAQSAQALETNKNNRQAQMFGTGLSAAALAFSDKNLKTDVQEFDAEDFLNSLTGYKYSYKKPGRHGEGKQVGVMAQDLEKTPAGKMIVEDTPEGKMVDYNKAGGPLFASLANLNERLQKLEGKK